MVWIACVCVVDDGGNGKYIPSILVRRPFIHTLTSTPLKKIQPNRVCFRNTFPPAHPFTQHIHPAHTHIPSPLAIPARTRGFSRPPLPCESGVRFFRFLFLEHKHTYMD